jgi:pyrrolidone-carboxylate peptidase
VWGAPLEQLPAWIEELKPVAIFSFGQGGETFSIERVASNHRGEKHDNHDQLPKQMRIAAAGPDHYAATADCLAIVDQLAAKGYPVVVSARAGRYLCEECLYSLEHLKATGRAPQDVLFCHVPKLGSTISGKPAEAGTIQQFVTDTLEAWRATRPETKTAEVQVAQAGKPAAAPSGEGKPAGDSPEEAEIRKFIDRYFDTWSKQDMRGYGDCFSPAAVVQFIDAEGRTATRGKGEFLATQIAYQGNTKNPADERPVKVEIAIEAKLARALVYWKLVAGQRVEYGYDHFTLGKENGRWKILNLVFYSAEPPK